MAPAGSLRMLSLRFGCGRRPLSPMPRHQQLVPWLKPCLWFWPLALAFGSRFAAAAGQATKAVLWWPESRCPWPAAGNLMLRIGPGKSLAWTAVDLAQGC